MGEWADHTEGRKKRGKCNLLSFTMTRRGSVNHLMSDISELRYLTFRFSFLRLWLGRQPEREEHVSRVSGQWGLAVPWEEVFFRDALLGWARPSGGGAWGGQACFGRGAGRALLSLRFCWSLVGSSS